MNDNENGTKYTVNIRITAERGNELLSVLKIQQTEFYLFKHF